MEQLHAHRCSPVSNAIRSHAALWTKVGQILTLFFAKIVDGLLSINIWPIRLSSGCLRYDLWPVSLRTSKCGGNQRKVLIKILVLLVNNKLSNLCMQSLGLESVWMETLLKSSSALSACISLTALAQHCQRTVFNGTIRALINCSKWHLSDLQFECIKMSILFIF